MDPLTQGVLGAALPAATRRQRQARLAAAMGFLAGLAADLDVLIRSETDSLLYLEYHRQFTHSLIFIPVGGLLVAGLFFLLFRRWLRIGFPRLWLFSTLGYGTHGLLDAATSYGTQLFWPFSDERVSFSIISIIDPLFTLPLLTLVLVSTVRGHGLWARLGLAWAGLYLAFGVYQHHAASVVVQQLAAARGHAPVRLEVKPTFANLIVWRSIYEFDGRYFIDGVRPGFATAVYPGTSVAKLDVKTAFPWLDPGSQQARDIGRFTWFSQGFVAKAPDGTERVIDVRYSFLPTELTPLWSLALDPGAPATAHARYQTHRSNAGAALQTLTQMVLGRRPPS